MGTARKVVTGFVFGAVVLVPAGVAAAAANPSGTGLPSQSCQDIVAAGGLEPGHASSSPGSPFNEPGPGNPGGTGGLHYNATSQYDVACFQVSSR
jgi:hypothetical protein